MRQSYLRSIGVLAAVTAIVALIPELAAGQVQTRAAKPAAAASKWTAPRTPWGDPDLQGNWTNATTTPLERPSDVAGKLTLTAEERAARDAALDGAQDRPLRPGDTGAYNAFWGEAGKSSGRTSLIVDPPDGKLPALTPEAQKRADAIEAVRRRLPASWMDVNAYDRCISRGLPGAMMPGFYNHNYSILQAPGYVVILVEMIHDTRIIPLDGRPNLGPGLKQWMGHSRGRWEGDTLVVETTNFNDKIDEVTGNAMRLPDGQPLEGQRYHGVFGTADTTLIERFTRVDANTIDYRFTMTAPKTFVKPWTAAAPMTKLDAPLFEYACHEGNRAIPNMLSGARAQEQAAPPKVTEGRP
jgi:hypothetical protein